MKQEVELNLTNGATEREEKAGGEGFGSVNAKVSRKKKT